MLPPIKILERSQRIAQIKHLLAQPIRSVRFHEYQGRPQELPVIRVSIDLLLYRMANFRTQTAQSKWLRDEKRTDTDFFSRGEENQSAQSVQQKFLLDLSKKGTEQITPIYDVLAKSRSQTEEILITHAGVVLNGNRRLAAMRHLFAEDPAGYNSFSHVECIVLPESASDRDLEEIEVKLQMARETKLPYGWVDLALAMKKLLMDGVQPARIKELMNLETEEEVSAIITRIDEAELYLNEYKGTPNVYEVLDTDEQMFKELEKALKGKSGSSKETRRWVAHVIIGNKDVLSGRQYNYRFAFGKDHDEVINRIAIKYDLCNNEETQVEDPLEIDLSEDVTGPNLADLKMLLRDKSQGSELAKDIVEILDEIDAEQEEQKSNKRSVNLATQAFDALNKIDVSRTPSEIAQDVIVILQRVQEVAAAIIAKMEMLKS